LSNAGTNELLELARRGCIKCSVLNYWMIYLPECSSVVSEAEDVVERGGLEGSLILTDEVLGSPKGVLEYALILKPSELRGLVLIKLMMASSIARSIEELSGLEARVRWPGDLVHADRLLGRVSIELPRNYVSPHTIIVHSVINVNNEPSSLGSNEVSIKDLVGPVSRSKLLELILRYFDELYADLVRRRLRSVVSRVRKYLETIGRYVVVATQSEGVVEGVVVDIDYDGSLLIDLGNGRLVSIYDEDIIQFKTHT